MNKSKLYLKLGKIFAIIFAIGLIITIGSIAFPNKYITAFAVACPITALLLAIFITLMVLYYLPDKDLKKRWERYASLPETEIADYVAELEQVRKNYAEDTAKDKNKIETIDFFGSAPLYDFSVLQSGKIYYGYLVEANSALFLKKNGQKVYPGAIVYSTDAYYESHPEELKEIAETMYDSKPDNLLADERNYFTNVKINDKITLERQGKAGMFVTTLMFYRPHIPCGYITGGLMPVIADPEHSRSVFAVDAKYWTDALISKFVHGKP